MKLSTMQGMSFPTHVRRIRQGHNEPSGLIPIYTAFASSSGP